MLQIGDVIRSDSTGGDTWRVERALGSGTCCEAYKVLSTTDLKTKAALKIYKDGDNYHHAHDAEAMLLDLVARANGPCKYLVKTIDDFDHQDRPCLVQELLDLDLRQILYLNNSQGLSLYMIRNMARDILRGVEHLHKSGFVHADLKPTNLMWSPQDSCVKVIDYSLSYHVQDKTTGLLQSQGYRAPEVEHWNQSILSSDLQAPQKDQKSSLGHSKESPGVQRHEECSQEKGNSLTSHLGNVECQRSCSSPSRSSDLWSVGCILVELFMGMKFFSKTKLEEMKELQKQGTSLMTILQDIIDQVLQPRHSSEQADCVEKLKNLIQGLLHVEDNLRLTVTQALEHSFFKVEFLPDFHDLCLLSSPVLRLLNVVMDQDLDSEEAHQELCTDLLLECEKVGPVAECVIPREGPGRGKVYMAFKEHEDSVAAYSALSRRVYNNRTVILTYFPNSHFLQRLLY